MSKRATSQENMHKHGLQTYNQLLRRPLNKRNAKWNDCLILFPTYPFGRIQKVDKDTLFFFLRGYGETYSPIVSGRAAWSVSKGVLLHSEQDCVFTLGASYYSCWDLPEMHFHKCEPPVIDSCAAMLFIVRKYWNQLDCHSLEDRLHYWWPIHTRECTQCDENGSALDKLLRKDVQDIKSRKRGGIENTEYITSDKRNKQDNRYFFIFAKLKLMNMVAKRGICGMGRGWGIREDNGTFLSILVMI